MRIEITDPVVKVERSVWQQGDVVTVNDELGNLIVSQGWAKDVEGNVETGTKHDGPLYLDIQNIYLGVTDSNPPVEDVEVEDEDG
jgi:hypothetical protein